MKQKIKTYGFWISLTAAILVVLKVLGNAFSFYVNEELILGVVSSVCGVFVVLGFIHKPNEEKNKNENEEKSD